MSHVIERGGFAVALVARMSKREVGVVELGRATGVSRRTIADYCNGKYLPRAKVAFRIAEALDDPRLYDMVLRRREVKCRYCGTAIVSSNGGSMRRWCNATCRDRSRFNRTPFVSAEAAAIAVMCRACEPGGSCFTPDCPLRQFSPLLLAADVLTPLARSGTRRHFGSAA